MARRHCLQACHASGQTTFVKAQNYKATNVQTCNAPRRRGVLGSYEQAQYARCDKPFRRVAISSRNGIRQQLWEPKELALTPTTNSVTPATGGTRSEYAQNRC